MKLAIYGTGGSGKEAYEVFEECPKEKSKWDEIVFVDDTVESGEFRSCRRFTFEDLQKTLSPEQVKIVIAIGEPKSREILYNRIVSAGYSLGNIIHSNAVISKGSLMGNGIVLQDGVKISAEAEISDNVYINSRTLVGHNVKIGSHCQISANVFLAGFSKLEECVFIGVASCIRDHTVVGAHSVISMGSVVMKDVRPYKIFMGNPGREIADNKAEKIF